MTTTTTPRNNTDVDAADGAAAEQAERRFLLSAAAAAAAAVDSMSTLILRRIFESSSNCLDEFCGYQEALRPSAAVPDHCHRAQPSACTNIDIHRKLPRAQRTTLLI